MIPRSRDFYPAPREIDYIETMDEYERLDLLAERLASVEVEIEDLESMAATFEELDQLVSLAALRDELRGAIDALDAKLRRDAVQRLLEALAGA